MLSERMWVFAYYSNSESIPSSRGLFWAYVYCGVVVLDQNNEWAVLTKIETYKVHHAVFIPAMTYTFPVMHHTKTDLDKIQSAATTSTLLKLGFNRHTAQSVVYGSTNFLGLGLKSLYVEQGIAQILIIMRHLRAKSEIGELTMIALHWWHLLCLSLYPVLPDPISQGDTGAIV